MDEPSELPLQESGSANPLPSASPMESSAQFYASSAPPSTSDAGLLEVVDLQRLQRDDANARCGATRDFGRGRRVRAGRHQDGEPAILRGSFETN